MSETCSARGQRNARFVSLSEQKTHPQEIYLIPRPVTSIVWQKQYALIWGGKYLNFNYAIQNLIRDRDDSAKRWLCGLGPKLRRRQLRRDAATGGKGRARTGDGLGAACFRLLRMFQSRCHLIGMVPDMTRWPGDMTSRILLLLHLLHRQFEYWSRWTDKAGCYPQDAAASLLKDVLTIRALFFRTRPGFALLVWRMDNEVRRAV